jgi:predicted nucleotidyltransferase
MRLTQEQKAQICEVVRQFDAGAEVRLFGSLLDDNARGGDVDLLIISQNLRLPDKLKIRTRLKDLFGNRKIDLLITAAPRSAFERYALENSRVL